MTRSKIIWTKEEDELLLNSINFERRQNWKFISTLLQNKTPIQCFYRSRKINPVIIKTKWTLDEDETLISLQEKYGNNWSKIAREIKSRGPKQIRDRFINNLDPRIRRKNFTIAEDLKILQLKNLLGNKWSQISKHFEDRSPDIIKSRYYSSVKNKNDLLLFYASLDYPENNMQGLTQKNLALEQNTAFIDKVNWVDNKEKLYNINFCENSNFSIAKTNFLSSSKVSSEINCIYDYGKFSEIYDSEKSLNFN